jgi:hypothetical protein
MQIISHRGYWLTADEMNQAVAFHRSFDLGYGTETDLRDHHGKVVISHDMPVGDELGLEELLKIMKGRNLPLALNIKADGLIDEVLRLLKKYNHTNYFTFDMAIPDMLVQIRRGAKILSPLSDVVPTAPMLEQTKGVWLDCFQSLWYSPQIIDKLLEAGNKVCIVSSDLHKRFDELEHQWRMVRDCRYFNSEKLLICTDKLEECMDFFNL